MKINIIAAGGLSCVGKDLFCSIAANILKEHGYSSKKMAFADELKNDLDPFLREKYGISAWTSNQFEKHIIRPMLVSHGCCKREQTCGVYWVDKIKDKIDRLYNRNSKDHPDFILLSDVRFLNETQMVHEYGGYFVHISKFIWNDEDTKRGDKEIKTKFFDAPPNEEEKKNDPIIKKKADYLLEWENIKNGNSNITDEELISNKYLRAEVYQCLKNYVVFNV